MGGWCREFGASHKSPFGAFSQPKPGLGLADVGGPCKALVYTGEPQRPLGPITGLISGRMDYNVVFSMGQR